MSRLLVMMNKGGIRSSSPVSSAGTAPLQQLFPPAGKRGQGTGRSCELAHAQGANTAASAHGYVFSWTETLPGLDQPVGKVPEAGPRSPTPRCPGAAALPLASHPCARHRCCCGRTSPLKSSIPKWTCRGQVSSVTRTPPKQDAEKGNQPQMNRRMKPQAPTTSRISKLTACDLTGAHQSCQLGQNCGFVKCTQPKRVGVEY